MNYEYLFLLTLGFVAGHSIIYPWELALKYRYSVGTFFYDKTAHSISISFASTLFLGCPIASVIINPWWSIFIVVIVGAALTMFFFRGLGIMTVFLGYAMFIVFTIWTSVLLSKNDTSSVVVESTVVEKTGVVEDIEHFTKSLLLVKEAQIGLENSAQEKDEKKLENAMDRYKQALNEAEMVNVSNLNELVGEFGDMYEDNFTGGLRKILQGYDDRDLDVFNTGQTFLQIWGEWYKDKYNEIEISLNNQPKPQPI